jgi:N utilization substance protein B
MSTPQQQSSRKQSRELAFQYLFSREKAVAEPASHDSAPFSIREDFLKFSSHFDGAIPDDYTTELVLSVTQHKESLDQSLGQISKNWRVGRMPLVDLTILRLAACEILHFTQTPKTVVINEAVELAKKYGGEGSGAFVNGLLDQLGGTVS